MDKVCCGVASCGDAKDWSCAIEPGSCKKKLGAACADKNECGSVQCADGLCCDTACTGQCEACDIPDPTTERKGKCTPVKGKPHGARAACPSGAGDVCKEALCDGDDRTACKGLPSGNPCREQKCAAGQLTPAAKCDGKGLCPTVDPVGCGVYTCTSDGSDCRKSCTAELGCAEGFLCKEGKCEKVSARCSTDGLSSTSAEGVTKSCAPYRCGTGGECEKACATSADCVGGTACDVAAKLCVPPTNDESDGGCGVSRATTFGGASLVLLGALGLVRWRRAR